MVVEDLLTSGKKWLGFIVNHNLAGRLRGPFWYGGSKINPPPPPAHCLILVKIMLETWNLVCK